MWGKVYRLERYVFCFRRQAVPFSAKFSEERPFLYTVSFSLTYQLFLPNNSTWKINKRKSFQIESEKKNIHRLSFIYF